MHNLTPELIDSFAGKRLSRADLIDLFMEALDEMNRYNGRSRGECLRLAMDTLYPEKHTLGKRPA